MFENFIYLYRFYRKCCQITFFPYGHWPYRHVHCSVLSPQSFWNFLFELGSVCVCLCVSESHFTLFVSPNENLPFSLKNHSLECEQNKVTWSFNFTPISMVIVLNSFESVQFFFPLWENVRNTFWAKCLKRALHSNYVNTNYAIARESDLSLWKKMIKFWLLLFVYNLYWIGTLCLEILSRN